MSVPKHAQPTAAGVLVLREPATGPWARPKIQIRDLDGIRIVLVEIPPVPLRRDPDRRYRREGELHAA